MMKKALGFTLVELLVVISVIGILATIVFVGFSTIQASSRDQQRASKIAVIAEGLEKYYDANGEYPSCSAMSQSPTTVVTNTLVGIDPNVLATPSAAAGTNSITCNCLTQPSGQTDPAWLNCNLGTHVTTDSFAYVGDGSTACYSGTGTASTCLSYTLQYKQEATGNIISLKSRRTTQLATSGTTVLSGSAASNTSININWTYNGQNATAFQISYALNNTFTSGLQTVNTSISASSYTMTGLSVGTLYYIKVAPYNGTNVGASSNTISVATSITPPASYTITQGGSTTYNTLVATANSVCSSGTNLTYQWFANGSLWESGPSYQTVSYTISNGQTVTLTSSSACTTTQATSTYTSASNSLSLTWAAPSAAIGTGISPGGYRAIGWGGSCPTGATSENFAWSTGGSINASGNTSGPSGYSNQGTAWGNGGANVTLTCYGPWGAVYGYGYGPYGPACVPTITNAATCDE
jgi:prepilin-type N-terminal cleavage/methylation domain-containing protein